jgi:zinc protease
MMLNLRVGLAGLALLAAAPAQALEIQDLTSPGGVEFWLVEEPSIPSASPAVPGSTPVTAPGWPI